MDISNKYYDYIQEHCRNVDQVWCDIQEFLVDAFWIDAFMYNEINKLIQKHDESKTSKEEFNGYRQYFYPEPLEEKNELSKIMIRLKIETFLLFNKDE
jgi:hypothetical protein